MNSIQQEVLQTLIALPAIVIGFTAHEFAHAATAVAFGDNTPREQGRFTLNPLKHIDLIGLVMILVLRFGWAKPVEYNPSRLKRPVEYGILITLAGPFANLIMAMLSVLGLKFCLAYHASDIVTAIVYQLASINVMLCLFNLIPLPPLDGAHVLYWAIPDSLERVRQLYMQVGYWVLIALVFIPSITGVDFFPIGRLCDNFLRLLLRLFGV
jgi:Zn-dependent protease